MKLLLFFLGLFLVAPCQGANLVPNSSFECGLTRGWYVFNDGVAGADNARPSDFLVSTNAWHGATCLRLNSSALSRAIWLTPGAYTVSFYGYATNNVTINYGVMDAGLPTSNPATSAAITNGWARFSVHRTITTNGFYWVKFYNTSAVSPLIDAVQLELAPAATDYQPMALECGLDSADPNNLFFAGDSKAFRFRFWNNGPAQVVTAYYNVYDLWNRTLLSHWASVSLPETNSLSMSMPLPSYSGWMRIVSRLANVTDSGDETTVTVLPYVSGATNSFLGSHPLNQPTHAQLLRRSGVQWARTLSPADATGSGKSLFRWDVVNPSRGTFIWNDAGVNALATNGLKVLACLVDGGSGTYWPGWATNGDGTPNMADYSNYCYTAAARYSNIVSAYEVWNEPHQSTIFLTNASSYLQLLTNAVLAIKAGDSNALVVAMGGWSGYAPEWTWQVWTNCSATVQTNIGAISFHIYPPDNTSDPNDKFTFANQWGGCAPTWAGTKPIWNTESGTWLVGGWKTTKAMFKDWFDVFTSASPESSRAESQARQLIGTERILTTFLRTIGNGFAHFDFYDSRQTYSFHLTANSVSGYELDYTLKPTMAAVLASSAMIGGGYGPLTNSSTGNSPGSYPYIELYQFTNGANSVVAGWTMDRTNRVLTLTNTALALYDCMGNQISTNAATITFTRTPRLVVSGTMSLVTLSNTLKYASAVSVDSTTGPALSLDIVDGSGLVKWTALDQKWMNSTSHHTNILYQYSLDGGAYSALSESNHLWLDSLNHTSLVVQAVNVQGYSNSLSVGFSDPAPQSSSLKGSLNWK